MINLGAKPGKIIVPEREVLLPWFAITAEAERERKRLLAGQYFLVELGRLGEIPKCGRCGAKHRYLTKMCRELPFSGLTEGLYAYWQTAGAMHRDRSLNPRERSRLREMGRHLTGTADLATVHPDLARRVGTPDGDMDMGALAIGILHRLTREEAKRYLDRINATGIRPRMTLPGIGDGSVQVSRPERRVRVQGQGVHPPTGRGRPTQRYDPYH